MKKTLNIIVESTSTGYSCYVKEINGLATVGSNLIELSINFYEALNYHIEYYGLNEDDDLKIEFDLNWLLPKEPVPSIEGKTPKERWENLKAFILTQIEEIDAETQYSETIPKWWLEMSDTERHLNNNK